MEIAKAERNLRRAQRMYNKAIHQVDDDKDVLMRDIPPIKCSPMEDVEETPVILPIPPKTMIISVLVNGFYCPIQIQYA
jgi:hypothetical protein